MFVNTSQQLAENKLLLLYIFKRVGFPLTNSQITQLILENEIMNYFALQQFLAELKESDFIWEEYRDNAPMYGITQKGKETLQYFINRIPNYQIEKIEEILKDKKNEYIRDTQIKADYVKLAENEYLVTLSVIEQELPIFTLKLSVANNKQAKQICENWRKNAQDLYGNIIHLLIEE